MPPVRIFPGIHIFAVGLAADRPADPDTAEDAFFAYDTGALYIASPALAWVAVEAGEAAVSLADISISFTADGDAYYVAPEAVTFASATEKGTGTLTYAKAASANPTTFNSATLPVSLATGDVLKITVADLSGYKALTLVRSA